MKFQEYLPVVISISVLVLVAVVQKQSRLVAAVTATMPVTIPLTLWIVYSSSQGDRQVMKQFTNGMVSGIIPTVAFVITIWLGSRFGLKLVPLIGLGYAAWALTLAGMLVIRRLAGA